MQPNARPMTRMQLLAMRLATMPMIVGLVLLIVWLQVEWQPLIFMGYGCLGIGVLSALFAPFLLLRSWPDAPNVRNTVLISVLAVANVPVAFFSMLQGVFRYTRLHVEIRNDADTEWQDVQLVGGGILGDATPVPKDSLETRNIWATQDGRLELHYIDNEVPCRVIVAGYVTPSFGGDYTVTRDAAGVVTVVAHPK
ncbi:MAG: hypothetical protein ACI91B_002812 [Planctomycetota bacterium]|jgi:hypothetical protein